MNDTPDTLLMADSNGPWGRPGSGGGSNRPSGNGGGQRPRHGGGNDFDEIFRKGQDRFRDMFGEGGGSGGGGAGVPVPDTPSEQGNSGPTSEKSAHWTPFQWVHEAHPCVSAHALQHPAGSVVFGGSGCRRPALLLKHVALRRLQGAQPCGGRPPGRVDANARDGALPTSSRASSCGSSIPASAPATRHK